MGEKTELHLSQLKPGQKGVIARINGGYGMRARLEALGIRTGCEITEISSMVMAGPVVLRVGHTEVAVGRGMAKKIIVEVEG